MIEERDEIRMLELIDSHAHLDDEKFDFSKPITKNIKLEAKWEKIEK